jgi:hypothetical protein
MLSLTNIARTILLEKNDLRSVVQDFNSFEKRTYG